jgi:DNA-binding HxlR family transcriptional regulator
MFVLPDSDRMMVTNDWEVGTRKLHTYQKESDAMASNKVAPSQQSDPELEALVREIIGRVADKWTMLVLEALEEHGRMRFTRLGEFIEA